MNPLEPQIVNSQLADDVQLSVFAEVLGSTLAEGACVYRMARVKNSMMGRKTHLGDCSRLDDSRLRHYARIDRFNHLTHADLGEHSYTGPQTVIMHTAVGRYTSIAWGVTIGGAEHDMSCVTTHSFLYNDYDRLRPPGLPPYNRFGAPLSVGHDVWIGANAVITRGVTVGHGAVVAANAVVTRDVAPYSVVAGVPARVVKARFNESTVSRLLAIRWWEFPESLIREQFQLFAAGPSPEVLEQLESLRTGLDAVAPTEATA